MKSLTTISVIFFLSISCATENKKIDKDFFVFTPDIRLFTSYSFMNAAGYNPQRVSIATKEIRQYY